ncbi:MAG: ABC transporter ATP-binding protein [Candidatus Omnitrophica bacterium]|nr:ABC transporter ATP-binding protein [Candidatus Omnitrophota bacterium]
MLSLGVFLQRFGYLLRLLTTTPYWGLICMLQFVSGLASFLGLPLLIPVLEMMQSNTVSVQGGSYAKFVIPFLQALGLKFNFNSMLFMAAVLMLLGQLLVNASSLVCTFVKEDLLAEYRKKIFRAYASVDWQWLTDHHSARMYHAVVREAEQACEAHMNAQRIFINFFQIAVYLTISLRLSWQITLLAVGVYVLLGLCNAVNLNFINQFAEVLNQKFKQFSNDAVSFQHNKKFIKVALLGERFLASFTHAIDQMCQLRKRQMLHVELQRAWNMMSTLILLVVMIFFHQALSLNYATLLLILFVFMRLAPQFVALADVYAALDMSIPVHKSLQSHLQTLEDHREKSGSRAFVPGSALRFEEVSFAYPNQPALFSNLHLSIEPHTMVAIVGKSGCGKSTILDLLLGLLDIKGGVIYYGQIPHHELEKDSLRRHVAFVGQRPSLLDGTLRENLIVAKPSATKQEVLDVCRRVHLKEFIEELPQGLDTVVGENGIKLSGGQRQRIALARCLLLAPDILILDEATSELDSESEAVIQNTLKEMRSQMTIIIIAHRLSTVKAADKIYVIEHGTACESGAYEELLARKGRFYDLVSLQH